MKRGKAAITGRDDDSIQCFLPGYWRWHACTWKLNATREAPTVRDVTLNWNSVRSRPGRLGGGEARSSDEAG